MPPGHRVDIIMNPDALPSSRDEYGTVRPASRPTSTSARVIKRSHASAWILLGALGATGGALAVATVRDPQGMREHLDHALAKVKHVTGASTPTTSPEPVVAQAPAPVQEPAPLTTAQSTVIDQKLLSSEAPLPPVAPAAGRNTTSAAPVEPVKQLATPAPSRIKEAVEAPPAVTTQLPPILPLTPPVQPLPPVQATPPLTPPPVPVVPPVTPPPVEEAVPVPPTPPASAPPQ